MNALYGKVALVTGAGVRVGAAIAKALGQRQMHVAVHYAHSRDGAEQTLEAIRAAGSDGFTVQADLANADACRTLIDDVLKQAGRLDTLVASAANFERVSLMETTEGTWDQTMALNLRAPWILCQHAAPSLKAHNGNVVLITCTSATIPYRNYFPYVISKGALRHMMRTLALELAPEVRVNAVAPGTVLPPDDMDAGVTEILAKRAPLGRIGTPDDVAEAVVYLTQAPFVTGQEIVVDGGRSVANWGG